MYALAFLAPATYRGAAEAARALGFDEVTQLTAGYVAFGSKRDHHMGARDEKPLGTDDCSYHPARK